MPKRHRTTKTTKRRNTSKLAHPWLWVGIAGIVILLVVVGFLILPKGSIGELPPEITPEQAFQKYQQGAFFLDVRTLDDWKQVHIARSTLIPWRSYQPGWESSLATPILWWSVSLGGAARKA
jgi:hypothetical protein